MSWLRLDDGFADHPKLAAAGPLAAWLHVCALVYCSRYLTDGFLPSAMVPRLADFRGIQTRGQDVSPEDLAARLADVGLWEPVEGGYRIHDYLAYNPSRAQVLEEREQTARRVSAWRNARRNAVTNGAVTPAPGNAVTNADVTASPYPSPIPDPSLGETKLGSGSRRLTTPVPGDARSQASATPEARASKSHGLGPLVDAFRALGLPEPTFVGPEARAAKELLSHWAADEIARCWQDIRQGRWGDDFARRELSFGYLLTRNRMANWKAWKEGASGTNRSGGRPGGAARRLAGRDAFADVDQG